MIIQLQIENFHIPSSSPRFKTVCLPTDVLALRYSLVDRGRGVSLAHFYFPAEFYQDIFQDILHKIVYRQKKIVKT